MRLKLDFVRAVARARESKRIPRRLSYVAELALRPDARAYEVEVNLFRQLATEIKFDGPLFRGGGQ